MVNIGRVSTKKIKSIAFELIKKMPDKFTNKFENNKQVIKGLNVIDEKRATNKIAGYVTRTMKRQETGK